MTGSTSDRGLEQRAEGGERRVSSEHADAMRFLLEWIADEGLHPLAITVLAGEVVCHTLPRVQNAQAYATGQPVIEAAGKAT